MRTAVREYSDPQATAEGLATSEPSRASVGPEHRIVFVDHTAVLSGAELCLADTIPHFPNARVLLFEDGPLVELLRGRGLDVEVLETSRAVMLVRRSAGLADTVRAIPGAIGLAREVARRTGPSDVIYANSQKSWIVAALAAWWYRRTVVWHLHDVMSAAHFSQPLARAAVALANRVAATVIVNSKVTAEAFIALGGRRDLVRVVYNGIDASAFEPVADRAALRRQLGLDPNALTLGLFGRITPWKGQHVLLDALKELPGAHALIVGGPLFGETDYVNELERLARYPALAGRVRFLGFRGDIPALMQAVDIVAHTSTSPEPFGRVIVEAMLARRPVVATATGGVLEIVDDGLDGVLVPPADPRALAKAIARLADDSGMRESLVEAGYRKASSQFSHAGMVAAVDAVMREVCSSMAGPREASIAEILPIELAQSRQRSDVLFVSQSAEPSGAELSLCDMATGLGRDALVCLFEQGPLVEILRSRGVQVNVLADARLRKVHGSARMSSVLLAIPSVLRLAADVRRLSRRRGAALLYANSQKAWIVSALVAWWDRKPVVWHLRDMLSSPRFAHLQRSIAVFLANRVASRVIVNSGATGDAFAAVGGRRDLLRLVHNGIDPRPFEAIRGASSSPLRRELDLGDSVVVGMFGRLAPWKGQHVFLEALERLPGVHGLIVGDALFGEHEYRDELRSLAARPSLRGRVRFLGHRADVAELMRAVDIVVHASIEPEPFGRVIVEGMLAERPVIATVGGGVAEIVTHGVDGLLVEAGDSAALAASIKSLSEDEARAKKIAAAGRQTAQEHFLVEAMCNGVAGVVDELLQIGSCPRR